MRSRASCSRCSSTVRTIRPSRATSISRRGKLTRPGIAAALLALGLLLSVAFVGITVQRNAVARDIASLSIEIAQEQARRAALEAQAAEKSTDAYVADKSRELGFVRPGEGI